MRQKDDAEFINAVSSKYVCLLLVFSIHLCVISICTKNFGFLSSFISSKQFPLSLAEALTIHKTPANTKDESTKCTSSIYGSIIWRRWKYPLYCSNGFSRPRYAQNWQWMRRQLVEQSGERLSRHYKIFESVYLSNK